MKNKIIDTDQAIYRITTKGEVFTQSKLKIPLVTQGMEFSGEFKHILKEERLLTSVINNRGYYSVRCNNRTKMVHRLVAECFIPNPKNKPFVNHLDGNKLNNNVENLEWCTCQENNAHAHRSGLIPSQLGIPKNYSSAETKNTCLANLLDKSKLTDDEVRYVRSIFIPRHKDFSATALAKMYGTSVPAMAKIVKGETYKHVI